MIKNRGLLLSHGNIPLRKVVIDILDRALEKVNLYSATRRLIKLKGDFLSVGALSYNLKKLGSIYVLGAGKSTRPIAEALEDILGDRISGGVIILKRGEKSRLQRIKVLEASHPLPDENGLKGARKVLEVAGKAKDRDLVFCVITGGSSALMPLPPPSISLEEKREVTDLLLRSGVSIQEINAVRKHLSLIKGGRLALQIHPAEIINLTVSDVIGDYEALDCITDPTVPDRSTFKDALEVLRRYKLLEKVPSSVRKYLEKADPNMETVKDFKGLKVHTFILATNRDLCEAAENAAKELGFESMLLSTMIEGESREVGVAMAGIAKEIERNTGPIKPPCVVISGGETTVTICEEAVEGGPNQEFVLGFALKISGSDKIAVAAIDTDGTDGPTGVAGGVADGYTITRAEKVGIDVFEDLRRHNSTGVLKALGDTIYTGPTGINVMNLRVMVIGK